MPNRREFLGHTTRAGLSAAMGMAVPYAPFWPEGLIPVGWAQAPGPPDPLAAHQKDGLRLLNDRPLNAETPAHRLDDEVTPAARMFVRNNGVPPAAIDPKTWTLTIEGEAAEKKVVLSMADLRKFEARTYHLQLECGGNGRSEFVPSAGGNQWTTGAISCGAWTGARLSEVLARAGVKKNAVYIGYYGKDTHLSGDLKKTVISRGVPIAKAMQAETLLAWQLNGQPIPLLHGAPLRLVCGGWPASASGKWVDRLVIRDRVHDGPKMGGKSYRVPCRPVKPGAKVADEDMCIIESMPVKSLITFPKSGGVHAQKTPLEIRGHAWAGELSVASVFVSTDFGRTWQKTRLSPPKNRLAWQRFHAQVKFPQPGYYEVWARAVDDRGQSQPMVVPGWNPKGYLNHACHRIAVKVT